MFEHFVRFPWVLPIYEYHDDYKTESVVDEIIGSAETKVEELKRQSA